MRFNHKVLAIVVHDLAATALALYLSFYLRFDGLRFEAYRNDMPLIIALMLPLAFAVYHHFALYQAKWRFASMPDLINIFRAGGVLAIALLAADYVMLAPQVRGSFYFGKAIIFIYFIVQVFLLGIPRLAYRSWKDRYTASQTRQPGSEPVLVLARASEADTLLRAIEAGSLKGHRVTGLLSSHLADVGQTIRGVRVLGTYASLADVLANFATEGRLPRRLVVSDQAVQSDEDVARVTSLAQRYGLNISRIATIASGSGRGATPTLAPFTMEDLLLRSTVEIDGARLRTLVEGACCVVTGGGGSIGSEIARRLVRHRAGEVVILENSEPALYAITQDLKALAAQVRITGHICDVRDRDRVFALLSELQPAVIVHAAALKHVDILERDWSEGIKTNVLGSRNVADAAQACGAKVMVMVSTDKAVAPVSILGATKRLAEMYVQGLDHGPCRMISVRFGNVLGSNGSVVPLFKAQIESGGPVTVTHPDVVRYFMTISEASDLVLTAASHALEDTDRHTSVYVLNMGQPIRIMELAERMIRLANLEPGKDIEIKVTGLRPGERLEEYVLSEQEKAVETGISGVAAAMTAQEITSTGIQSWMAALEDAVIKGNRSRVSAIIHDALPSFPQQGGEDVVALRPLKSRNEKKSGLNG